MKTGWDSLMKRTRNVFDINIDPMFADSIYERYIVSSYTENRYYHTLRHIRATLNALKDFHLDPEERVKVELGLWFHDVVYDASKEDNEKQSAEHFARFAKYANIPFADSFDIMGMIMATRHVHLPVTLLQEIICDCDLAELASPYHSLNSKNVRKEYGFLSDDEWILGRSQFINSMLSKEHIYNTVEYRGALEDTARHNLKEELDTINKE